MRMSPRVLLCCLALAAAAPAPASAAPGKAPGAPVKAPGSPAKAPGAPAKAPGLLDKPNPALVLGIADQKSDLFTDPKFQALGVRHVRVAVAWDALKTDWQVAELDRWMALARASGVEPLVTWAPSRLAGQRTNWPSEAQFVEQFDGFRARYPWVKLFSTWNEANFNGFGPWDKPELAGRWWLALTKACPSCTILGADLHDTPSMVRWTKRFLKVTGKRKPKVWGLHNYVSINRLQTQPIADLLAVTKARVWLTETGGLVKRRSKSLIKLPEGVAHQKKVTQFLLGPVARMKGVERIYVYQWNSSTATDSWDSSFVSHDGLLRPALAEFVKRLPKGRRPLPAVTVAQIPDLVGQFVPASRPAPVQG